MRINQPARDEVVNCWRLGELRLMAHEKNVPWLYGKEVREQHRLPHNTQVDAMANGVCACHLDPRPGKYEVNHLRSSMGSMVAKGLNDFLILCHTDTDRRAVVELLINSLDELPENVCVLNINRGREYLARRFNGVKPYSWLTEALTSTYNDIRIEPATHSNPVTPLVAVAGERTYYLADYSDGNVAELLRVYRHDSYMGSRYGKPGETLMQVRDKAQLDEIAEMLDRRYRHKSKITYILMQPHEGCNVFVIEDGIPVPR